VIGAAGTSQRRLLSETLRGLQAEGFSPSGRPEEADWQELFSSLRTGGLFAAKRLFVVENALRLGPFPEELLPYVEGEGSESALVLVFDGDYRKNLGKELLGKAVVVKAPAVPPWGARRVAWVRKAARDEGVDLDGAAAALLAEWIDDAEEIRAQLPKLALAARGGPVDVGLVEALCLDEGGKSLLRLLDGLCRGREVDVLAALRILQEEPSILPVVTALHNRLRLALYQALLPPGEARRILAALKARDYATRVAGEAARRYGPEALKKAVAGLIALNAAEKLGRGRGWNGLTLLLLELLGAGR
jgi:DNA polymerase-3 subunit delta